MRRCQIGAGYARLSGAEAGTTLLNQGAYELIHERFSRVCDFEEIELPIKHEGSFLAYKVRVNDGNFPAVIPEWERAPDVEEPSGKAKKK